MTDFKTHECRSCGCRQEVALADVSSFAGPEYVWGCWKPCSNCGSLARPTELVDANDPRVLAWYARGESA